MSGVFQSIDPPPPSLPGVLPPHQRRGVHTRWAERGWGVNTLEDARQCSVLYLCKYENVREIILADQKNSPYVQCTLVQRVKSFRFLHKTSKLLVRMSKNFRKMEHSDK
jgi:hypothetical protein